jgi:hypothetical protein
MAKEIKYVEPTSDEGIAIARDYYDRLKNALRPELEWFKNELETNPHKALALMAGFAIFGKDIKPMYEDFAKVVAVAVESDMNIEMVTLFTNVLSALRRKEEEKDGNNR